MVHMNNITRTEEEISGDAFVEDCTEAVHVVFNRKTKEFSYALPKEYSYCTEHIMFVMQFFEQNENNPYLPDKKVFAWY